MRTIEKIVCIFMAIVFVTFMANHGKIDFSGVDFVVDKSKEAVQSEEGQKIIGEVKEISVDIIKQILDGIGNLVHSGKTSTNDSLLAYNLVRVVDGDTIVVSKDSEEYKVRLIGIDTPESVHSDASQNNEYGVMASNYTKSLLEDTTTVYLEFDQEETDPYGRKLAYVWLKDNISQHSKQDIANEMLNGILVRNGYAIDKCIPPNTKYADIFTELREDAYESKAGLWIYDGFTNLW